ncbi:hypothetical protein [Peribacillus asahii]|uniref:hypothetical protein n=1 Tax=Peribacillus asahii TaxID=228899 RepID=UPI003829A11A
MGKGKKVLKVVGAVFGAGIIFFIGAGIGSSGQEAIIEEKTVSMAELDKEIASLEKEESTLSKEVKSLEKDKEESIALIDKKESVEAELAEVNAKLKDTKGALDEELKEGRKDIEAKLEEANTELSDKQEEVASLDSEIDSKEKELSSLTGEIKEAEGKPKTLIAGQYVVGRDVPEGRYKVTNVGRGTNFFVYDGDSGSATVNTILGDSSVGRGDYIFFTADGDIIETRGQVKLTPVE